MVNQTAQETAREQMKEQNWMVIALHPQQVLMQKEFWIQDAPTPAWTELPLCFQPLSVLKQRKKGLNPAAMVHDREHLREKKGYMAFYSLSSLEFWKG